MQQDRKSSPPDAGEVGLFEFFENRSGGGDQKCTTLIMRQRAQKQEQLKEIPDQFLSNRSLDRLRPKVVRTGSHDGQLQAYQLSSAHVPGCTSKSSCDIVYWMPWIRYQISTVA